MRGLYEGGVRLKACGVLNSIWMRDIWQNGCSNILLLPTKSLFLRLLWGDCERNTPLPSLFACVAVFKLIFARARKLKICHSCEKYWPRVCVCLYAAFNHFVRRQADITLHADPKRCLAFVQWCLKKFGLAFFVIQKVTDLFQIVFGSFINLGG